MQANTSANKILFVFICCALLACTFSTPTLSKENTSKNQEWLYTLRPSDNFKTFSKEVLKSQHAWTDLVRYNRIDDIASIEPGSIIRVPMKWLKQQPKPAKILSITGSAQIKRAKRTHFNVLKANDQIYVGDEVATKNGTLFIKLADSSLIRLEKDSNLVFNKLSHYGKTGMVDTQLRLKKGALSTEVIPLVKGSTYEITTPSAVAAVRGTKFRLDASKRETKIEVTEGAVNFSYSHGETIVKTGEGARVKLGSASIEKSVLPEAPKAKFSNQVINKLPATLNWQDVSNSYHYELSDANNKVLQTVNTHQPEIKLNNVKNGQYQVAMRAINQKGFEGFNQNTKVNINVPTEIAEQLEPLENSTISSIKPSFSWRFTDLSIKGKLEISDHKEFNRVITNSEFNHKMDIALSQNLSPGQYFWRVVGLTNNQQKSTSPIRTFYVQGVLEPVTILSVNYIDNQVGLFWGKIENAKRYTLQVSDTSNFSTILKEESIDKTKAHLRLNPGKQYFARVKGISDGPYSSNFGPTKALFIPK